MSLLEIRRLARSYGGIRAVVDLDLDLTDGELRCLIGPNGAGKSTVFKLVMGLERPDGGSIRFLGRDITRLEPFARVRCGLSMKYQTTRVFSNLSVEQNIAIACGHSRLAHGMVPWALDYFDLQPTLHQAAGTLSYGQQHWLEMVLALGTRPRLLLMDEPTAGMTPDESSRTAAFVKAIRQQGVTLLVVAHDMAFVREIAELVTVLHQGELFCQGQLEEVENDPDVRRIYLGDRRD